MRYFEIIRNRDPFSELARWFIEEIDDDKLTEEDEIVFQARSMKEVWGFIEDAEKEDNDIEGCLIELVG